MTTKEQMNTVPAYVVSVVDLANPNRYTPRTFRDADLLSARQAAVSYVQQVLTKKLAHEVLDITVDLAEVERSSVGGKHRVIATVFNQRFYRTMFMQDGKCLLKDMQLDAFTKKSLPPALFLTMNLEQDDKACNSLQALWNSLAALALEYEYYRNQGYSMGFGCVDLTDITTLTRLREALDPATMSDHELRQCVERIHRETAKTSQSYTVLYDGFTYAANLLNTYNQHYADEGTVLCFSTDFLVRQ